MSEKLYVKLPEVAIELLRLQQRSEDEKKSEEQKRSADIIKDYAYILGWYTAEDGPIDIEKVKWGLIELVHTYEKTFGGPGREYGVYRRAGNAGYTGSYYYENDGSLSVQALKGLKYDDKEIEYLQAVHNAYKLLEDTFEDFNEFVSEIWREFDGERRNAFNAEVAKWEKEKKFLKRA
jgi:hypothetical protein